MKSKFNASEVSPLLVCQVIDYLDYGNAFNLRSTSKSMKAIVDQHYKIFSKLAFFLFFPENFEIYCEFADCPMFCEEKMLKDRYIQEYPKVPWKVHLAQHWRIQEQWGTFLLDFQGRHDLLQMITKMFKEPELVCPTLKRENIGVHASSLMQTKICEILQYKPRKRFACIVNSSCHQFMALLQQNRDLYIEEVLSFEYPEIV